MMENNISKNFTQINPDAAIKDDDEDKLGFKIIAENMAHSLLSRSTKEGFVVGVEGGWGTGKSSLLNLLCNYLKEEKNVSIIRFQPWLISDSNAMTEELIYDIARAIEEIGSQENHTVSKYLQEYVVSIISQKSSSLLSLSSLLGVPHAEKLSAVLNEVISIKKNKKSIVERKEELSQELRNINRRFVVIIDDIDRLEPSEAVEITRLVRAVADFPNIVYLLAYDKEILSSSLECELKIQSGNDYLQKIVQFTFPVPTPEEFDIRRLLVRDCIVLYEAVMLKELNQDLRDRLELVCDTFGNKITTLREVVLVMNALRIIFPSVKDQVDFADLCWLQVIKVTNASLYNWIEEYLVVFSSINNENAILSVGENESMVKRLYKCLGISYSTEENIDTVNSLREKLLGAKTPLCNLEEYIPGIKRLEFQEDKFLFNLDADQIADSEKKCRLASPLHYRLYFSFTYPGGVLSDIKLTFLLNKLKTKQSIKSDLKILIDEERPQGGSMYESFIYRMKNQGMEALESDSVMIILYDIANTIDNAFVKEVKRMVNGPSTLYRYGREILKIGLTLLKQEQKLYFLNKLFTDTESIYWLLSFIVKHELRNHMLIERKLNISSDDKCFSKDELKNVIDILLFRLKGESLSRILSVADIKDFFYCWYTIGGKDDLTKFADEALRLNKQEMHYVANDLFRSLCNGSYKSPEVVVFN